MLLRQVDMDSSNLRQLSGTGSRIVLAYGEATGHAHTLTHPEQRAAVLLESTRGHRYLNVFRSSALVHDEHATLTITPGLYEINLQRQYRPRNPGWVQSQRYLVNESRFGRLWKSPSSGEDEIVVEVINATPESDGTREGFFIRVPPNMQTAKQAVAWSFGLHEDEYEPDIQS